QRARGILKGDLPTIDRDNDKNPVVALREIADETIDITRVEETLVKSLQRLNQAEEISAPDEASATAQEDLSEMIGLPNTEAFEDAGMQVGTGAELEATGFEDVDISSLDGDE
ncbi:MAG TPA: DNA-directed RNA polymerase subunit omega, partial [Alphaproteobacteria bacterium]|nr:DNA-directed RNA polymerase subunit omega [Alphaproteobacteria bacterium]